MPATGDFLPLLSLHCSSGGFRNPLVTTTSQPDFTPLGRAIARLEAGLEHASTIPNDDLLRDGVIQRFEFTYELCWKLLLRHLESISPDPEALDGISFPGLIRTGTEKGLLRSGIEVWKEFRRARGMTSHLYDHEKSLEVFSLVPAFLEEARFLLKRLDEEATGE